MNALMFSPFGLSIAEDYVAPKPPRDPTFGLGPPPPMPGVNDTDIVRTNAPVAASARNVSELQTLIRKAGGTLVVDPNSSYYLVAANNRLKFSIQQIGPDKFAVRESSMFMILIGVAVVAGVVLVSRSRG
jgi:hypothetical protein